MMGPDRSAAITRPVKSPQAVSFSAGSSLKGFAESAGGGMHSLAFQRSIAAADRAIRALRSVLLEGWQSG
jgi:hypothetical protein